MATEQFVNYAIYCSSAELVNRQITKLFNSIFRVVEKLPLPRNCLKYGDVN